MSNGPHALRSQRASLHPHAIDAGFGWLKNGNRAGDFRKAVRCGAKTRQGAPCRSPAMRNGRCRMHGGKSTGPRTKRGLQRSQKARWRHGRFSRERKEWRARGRVEARQLSRLLAAIDKGDAGMPSSAAVRGLAALLHRSVWPLVQARAVNAILDRTGFPRRRHR
jgi:hypothetical protein